MSETRQFIPALGLLATFGMAAYMVVQLAAQARPDLQNASTAEVRDARGQVILRGHFEAPKARGDETQRNAALTGTGVDSDASGTAEIEIDATNPEQQEIEFDLRQLDAGATFVFAVDGSEVGKAIADRRGRIEFEMESPNTQ